MRCLGAVQAPVETGARISSGKWKRLALLTLALSADSSEASVLTTLFPVIRTALGLSGADLGTLVAANKLAGAACSPLWIWLTRRWSRKAGLALAAGLWGIFGVALGFANGRVSLLILSCVLAAGYSGAPPIITEIVADLFDDRARGRAVGVMYGSVSVFGAMSGALVAQLSGFPGGWRVGFWLLGGISVAAGLVILIWFEDPGAGAGEMAAARPRGAPGPRLPLASAMAVFRVPSFDLMLLSRLLSGHLVIGSFGIFFLTSVRQFSDAAASLVLLPFGAGVCLGTFGGGYIVDRLHRRLPGTGRIAFLQVAQLAFAFVAFLATAFSWGGIGAYLALWGAMGFWQGVNPGVNRPIVMAVIAPELRGWAFMIMLAIVEPVGWAVYSFGVGWLGDRAGLQFAFLLVLVGVMVVNAAAITPLYWTYGRDAARARRIDAPPTSGTAEPRRSLVTSDR